MLILLGAVGFVLLIACSNIAGLMLVRATGRIGEYKGHLALANPRYQLIDKDFPAADVISSVAVKPPR